MVGCPVSRALVEADWTGVDEDIMRDIRSAANAQDSGRCRIASAYCLIFGSAL